MKDSELDAIQAGMPLGVAGRAAISLIASELARRKWAKLKTPKAKAEATAAARAVALARTPEQRAEAARLGWVNRRKRTAGKRGAT